MAGRSVVLVIGLLSIVSGAPLSGTAQAQSMVGTNPYWGVCFGTPCNPIAPPFVGIGSSGAVCYGANCGRIENGSPPPWYRSSPEKPTSWSRPRLRPFGYDD